MDGAPLILLNDSARMARDAAPRGHVRDLSTASEVSIVAGEPEAELTVRTSESSAERGWMLTVVWCCQMRAVVVGLAIGVLLWSVEVPA